MVEVKGSAITARIRFVRERYGEPEWRRFKAGLPEAVRGPLEAGILPHVWAPYDLFVELVVAIDHEFGRGDLALCREMGRYSAEVNLPTLYRIFYKLGSPSFILKRAAKLWDLHYSSGAFEVEEMPGGSRCRIVGFASPHRAHCLSVMAWAEQSVELSGGRVSGARETRCRTEGGKACEMEILWQ